MTKIVFFDTDCISSFLWTRTEDLLIHCYGNDMIIPRQVYGEISKVPHLKDRIDDMVRDGNLAIEDILSDGEANDLYRQLTEYDPSSHLPLIGKGEAAAIVLSKEYSGILASNNLRDVTYYAELFGLKLVSTADILVKVVSDEIISVAQADRIWVQMVAKRRKLPYASFYEYLTHV